MTTDPRTPTLSDSEIREAVRERYAASARSSLGLADGVPGCGSGCGCGTAEKDPISIDLYAADDAPSAGALAASLGCGNPTALAELHPGQVVLDLGSGGGLDVLLSARRVGPDGMAYGLDMTTEMVELARRNQGEAGVTNAEFLQGSIEDVPLPDASVDVVISNCVINLSTDKDAVLREAFRVLRPGGRFAVSDMVLLRELPPALDRVVGLWTGCIAGALVVDDYVARLGAAGFADASVELTRTFSRGELEDLAESLSPQDLPEDMDAAAAIDQFEGAFASAFVRAVKPA
jgi:SAM-dependent methyltransferase